VLRTLAVQNYRSLRRLVVPLTDLNVVTGPNGSGKSSLYRALRLLADASRNGAVAALAREGGLPATLWAGPEKIGRAVREGRYPVQGTIRTEPVALRLGFGGDDFGYAIDLGLPPPADTAFALDPEIKRECIWTGPVLRPSAVLCDRLGGFVKLRDNDGAWSRPYPVRSCDSMLSEFADPQRAPEVLGLRETIRSWRFYDHVRTDADAPARRSKIGTRHGLLRPLGVQELSDGTLRYLLWVAALLSPRPASLLVLNEPETSLHHDLLPAAAALIGHAAIQTQVIAVTHSPILVDALRRSARNAPTELGAIELVKEFGETVVAGPGSPDEPPWHWPKR
jgi:predicted ATPase